MNFVIGDKILFKNERLSGRVIKINSNNIITVVTEDGFKINASANELIRVEPGTDLPISYGNKFTIKDCVPHRKQHVKYRTTKGLLKIDLHIESLCSGYNEMDSFQIMDYQLEVCRKYINKAVYGKYNKLEIIHGIGSGLLKSEVHKILKNYNLRFFESRDGGSTQVIL